MPRPAIAIALPPAEAVPVASELREAGFEPIVVSRPDELDAVLADRRDVAVAILDGETDFDESLEYYSVLHDVDRSVATLMVVSQRALDRINANNAGADDEYLTRPYSAESMRWRIEAMCIRSHTVDDGLDALEPERDGDVPGDRVGVDQQDLLALPELERGGQVGGDRCLPDAAFRVEDRDDRGPAPPQVGIE